MLPVRLDEQEPAAWAKRLASGCEHEVCPAAVMQGVVEKCRVEAMFEVEGLHVGYVEFGVRSLLFRELAGDRDHLRGDVIAMRFEAVTCGEACHPA